MKPINYLLILISVIILNACSKSTTKNPRNEPPTVIEGTVVKIWNLLIPTAYATNFAILLGSDKNHDKCKDSYECVALIEVETTKIIDMAPLQDNKFKFSIQQPLTSTGYKLLVFNKDFVIRRSIVLSKDELQSLKNSLEINPESTLIAEYKESLLKERKPLSLLNSIIDELLSFFKINNLRDLALEIIENLGLKDYFDNSRNPEYVSLIKEEELLYSNFINLNLQEKSEKSCLLLSKMKNLQKIEQKGIVFDSVEEINLARADLAQAIVEYEEILNQLASGQSVEDQVFIDIKNNLESKIFLVNKIEEENNLKCAETKVAQELSFRIKDLILFVDSYFIEQESTVWECEDKALEKGDYLCGKTDHL